MDVNSVRMANATTATRKKGQNVIASRTPEKVSSELNRTQYVHARWMPKPNASVPSSPWVPRSFPSSTVMLIRGKENAIKPSWLSSRKTD